MIIRNSEYKVPPISRISIREYTEHIRKVLGITALKFPIMEFVEFSLPEIDFDFSFEIGTFEEMGGHYGLTIPSEKRMIIREDVYVNACNNNGRDLFTVAHELGHYLMHGSLSRVAQSTIIKPFESSEWQANCFASELLIPVNHPDIIKLSVSDIMHYCCVSKQAAEIAYNNIHNKKAPKIVPVF